MFDIGFWELLVIAVVLLLVMGPERLPEVARQAAFLVRKARQGMFRLRNEMRSEMDGTPFADLQKAKQEMADFKRDITQFGRDLADSAEPKPKVDQAQQNTPSDRAQSDLDNSDVEKNPSSTLKENTKAAREPAADENA